MNTRNQKKEEEMKKDTRSHEMKRILKKEYPDSKFSVRIEKFSMGESIEIMTDLIPPQPEVPQEITNSYRESTEFLRPWFESSTEIKDRIKSILNDFWHIRRDKFSGDILSGGNTYIDISSIR